MNLAQSEPCLAACQRSHCSASCFLLPFCCLALQKEEIRTARQHVIPIGLSELGEARLIDAEEEDEGDDDVADEESDEAGASDEAEQGGIRAF